MNGWPAFQREKALEKMAPVRRAWVSRGTDIRPVRLDRLPRCKGRDTSRHLPGRTERHLHDVRVGGCTLLPFNRPAASRARIFGMVLRRSRRRSGSGPTQDPLFQVDPNTRRATASAQRFDDGRALSNEFGNSAIARQSAVRSLKPEPGTLNRLPMLPECIRESPDIRSTKRFC
jgi:hypothetical protein